jgi:hypothetical protein
VLSVILASFAGAIVTMILAFCLRSGRRLALAAYAIFSAEMLFGTLPAALFGVFLPLLILAPILLLLGTIAYLTRNVRIPTQMILPNATPGGPWQPGGDCPFRGGDSSEG